MRGLCRLIAVALIAPLLVASPLLAQGGYFGRNKVQYKDLKFQVLKTEHFDIYYYPEIEDAAKLAARMVERWYSRLSVVLDHELSTRQPLILYASGPDFRQTNAVPGELGEGTGGVTEAYKRRIVLPFAGPIEASDHVLGHELVHAFQYDITGTNVSSGTAGALGLPLWFIEGMAEYLSIGPEDPHTAMWMREATRREELPEIDDLDNPKYFPYRYGHALWAYIAGKYGDPVVGNMLRAASGRESTYHDAIEAVLQIDSKVLSKEWHSAEFEAYRPIALVTKMPVDVARSLITKVTAGGDLNVSPELSPDGSKIMYFSERDLFSIDLFMADAKTGKVIRKITDTATSAHYESLQFLSSAGAWNQDGTRFVYPGISSGQAVLGIVNVNTGKREREIKLPEVNEVLNPAWSPDGKLIAFSGLVGGFNDLFVYDLEKSSLRRLTTDPFAEMDPDWSPDGTRIAFATDRFTTNLAQIKTGPMRLALIDVASAAITELGGFAGAKNISPQWSQDGATMFFLSDRQGVTNVYRMPSKGGPAAQITNLLTGASGITALSPAMSAAGGRLVFSAYENDGYNIYALDSEQQLAGMAVVELPRSAGVLAPRPAPTGLVYTSLEDALTGLPPAEAIPEPEPYEPDFSLDFVGQPTIGIGVDPFGTYAVGGISLLFSDMLGNHTIGTAAQVTSRFDEFGGQLFYLNRTRRWNWGGSVSMIPYVSRGFEAGITEIDGQPVFVEREYRYLQRDQALSSFVSYPFSRAFRAEFSGGFRRLGEKQDLRERVYSLQTGQQIAQNDTELASLPMLNFGEGSAALVYDTSIFGATSPIRGSRHRVELSQSAGGLTYSGVLADVRTYLMPVRPFTLALRGMYYGRLGENAEDARLPALFLGYSGLVRGYDYNSFESSECGINADGSCPVVDRLIGSRVAVANAELRFPLLGIFGGDQYYGKLPIEAAFFTDAGVAWGRSNRTGFAEGDNEPIISAGIALRMNLFGFAVGEVDYVRPLDRPGRGWLWQFSLRPGF